MDRKWRIAQSETILKDRWIDLRADHCVTPWGVNVGPYYVLSYSEWVHVVAITRDDELVLVRQYRHGAGEVFLELPGGQADAGEQDLEATARRELAEETGFVAQDWERITSLHPNPATHSNRIHFYLAREAAPGGPQRLDPAEAGLTVELWPIPAVLAGLRGGLLGHATDPAGLLLGLAAAGRLNLAG
jgi:8-oxo-dGTP pyrophosphatase MutT (NUDIX family)